MRKMRQPCREVINILPAHFRYAVYIRPIYRPMQPDTGSLDLPVKKYHPIDDLDPERWNSQHLRTRYYTTRLHVGAFYLPAFLEEMLEEVEEK